MIDRSVGEQVLDRARVDHDLAAVLAGAGPDVDHVVGDPDGVLVVLDHEHGVAEVAQADEGVDEPLVVALVQADRRLVEHVEHAHQAAADLAGQADALGLAAGQGAGRAVEGEVVEARRRAGSRMRALTSLTTRSAIIRSRSDELEARPGSSADLAIDRSHSS